MSLAQEQIDQFERLLELSFLRERRKQMKRRLQFEERDIDRLTRPEIEYRKGIKFQKTTSSDFDWIKFRGATKILEEQRKAKRQKTRKIIISIVLTIIALVAFWFYFSK